VSLQDKMTLAEAATDYLASLSPEERTEGQEINRFVRWFGGERPIAELAAHEVEVYPEQAGFLTPELMKRLDPVRAFLSYARKKKWTATSLAVHLKLPTKATPKKKASPRRSAKDVTLTAQGYVEKEKELSALKEERPRVAEQIRLAMADKDFRENAPLDAAKEYQGQLEARIRELEGILGQANIIADEKVDKVKVGVGSTVVLRDLGCNDDLRYTLVSPSEADPSKHRLSVASPLGKALLNRMKGEVVEVVAPVGALRYRIEDIQG